MKWLFFSLVLANVLIYAWYETLAGRQTAVTMTDNLTHSEPRLTTLNELAVPLLERNSVPAAPAPVPVKDELPPEHVDDSAPVDMATAALVAPAPVETRCVRIADLAQEQDALLLAQTVVDAGGVLGAHGSDMGARSRYWVMLPPFRSAAAAAPMLERLRAAGVRDYYLVRSGENLNAISLGLYSTREAAERRNQQMHAIGFSSRVEVVSSPVVHWWLEFLWPVGRGDEWRQSLPREWQDLSGDACR